ncbi:MAG: gluconate 2-dehydrogenase subunit 3 family protein [Blastocatellia bacterium]|nr:gluconate 2-dehydrogenase subunit 3 family protein [Blastocatellia bacterium]
MTDLQQQTLRAVVNRIIPPDDYPGAWDAGVGDYLTRQFEADLAPQLELYCAGLDAVEAESLTRFQSSFARLTIAEQDATLVHIEAGELLTSWPIPPARFFELLVNTTAEGYYSEPEQGGNRAAIAWAMTGFDEHVQS